MTEAMKFLQSLDWSVGSADVDCGGPEHIVLGALKNRRRVRDEYIAKFGFAVLDDRAIDALRPYGPFIEVGAGSGYWSYELRVAGLDSLPTDPGTGTYSEAKLGDI